MKPCSRQSSDKECLHFSCTWFAIQSECSSLYLLNFVNTQHVNWTASIVLVNLSYCFQDTDDLLSSAESKLCVFKLGLWILFSQYTKQKKAYYDYSHINLPFSIKNNSIDARNKLDFTVEFQLSSKSSLALPMDRDIAKHTDITFRYINCPKYAEQCSICTVSCLWYMLYHDNEIQLTMQGSQ